MPSTASMARGDSRSVRAMKLAAALLTSTSSGPCCQMRSIMASTWADSRTSHCSLAITPPVAACSSSTVACSTSGRRPQVMRIRLPLSKSLRNMSAPRFPAEQHVGDDVALDLVRALDDLHYLGVPEVAIDWIFVRDAGGTEQ